MKAKPIKVAFMINHIGDYHAARLKNFSEHMPENSELVIFQSFIKSNFYYHQQIRHKLLTKNLNIYIANKKTKLSLAFEIFKYLRQHSPDKIITLGYSDLLSLCSLFYAKVFKRQIIYLSDSKADDQERSQTKERFKGALINFFDGALVAGSRHREYFQSLGFRQPVEIGYDVIDNSFFLERAKHYNAKSKLIKKLNVLPEQYILCVSRMVERKRLDLVISLFESSKIYEQSVSLIIIGDGPDLNKILQRAKDSVAKDFIFIIPSVKNMQMPLYYSKATALLLASDYDQWGLCINEAMACGVPCVLTSKCGAANEIVIDEKTGVVFDNGDNEKAIAALRNLSSNSSYRESLSQAALAKMKEWDLAKFSLALCRLLFK